VAVISLPLAVPFSQEIFYTVKLLLRGSCIAWCACLRPSFCRYSSRQSTERWASWPGWSVT